MPKRKRKRPDHSQRGGLGVRKKLSEASRIGVAAGRLSGVHKYATVAECLDKYGRWELGHRLGTIVRMTSSWVWIVWDGDDDVTPYQQADAFYLVYRNKWRISNPRRSSPLDPKGGPPIPEEFRPAGGSLTGQNDAISIGISPHDRDGTPPTEENEMPKEMSNAAAEREAAKRAKDDLPERESYTAKQVASRCGTDAKTMRKFFRSTSSTVKPVGQGGRYEFDAADLPKIKKEFATWRKKADSRSTSTAKKLNPSTPPPSDMTNDEVMQSANNALSEGVDEDEVADYLTENLDPSEEDLEAIEELELDDLEEGN